jgi:hypothetical protein
LIRALQTVFHQFIEHGGIMTVTSETRPETTYLSVIRGRDEEPAAARTSIACVIPAYNNDFDYFLGVDGDTVVDQCAVEHLEIRHEDRPHVLVVIQFAAEPVR